MSSIQAYPFSAILGWSNSRYEMFSACRRQYYYHYYYRFDTEDDAAKIHKLRELTSMPLQIGSLAHDSISTVLSRLQKQPSDPIDRTRLADFIDRKVAATIASCQFSEIYYHHVLLIDIESIKATVTEALMNLLESERFKWIRQVAAANSRGWIIDPPGYGETRIDGLKAYCKVDFLFPVDSTLHILDWKTGKERPEKHATQIRVYAAWAVYSLGSPVDKTRPVIAYLLPHYHETAAGLNEYDLEEFSRLVRAQTQEMYAFCSDIEQNVPLPRDAFPMTKFSSVCSFCNYRELCGRE